MNLTPSVRPRWRGVPLCLACAFALSACATLPNLGTPPKPTSTGAWRDLPPLSASWPSDDWWRGYGDAQLDQLQEEALASAPSLVAAEARLRRATAGVDITDAANQQQLSANADAEAAKQSDNLLMPKSSLPQGNHGYARATLDFSWEIDFWGRNRAALAAATSEHEAAAADNAQARLMLTTSMATSYAELARWFAAEDTAREALNIREQSLRLIRQRYDNGLETLGAVRQAQAVQAAAQTELLAIQEQLELTRHQLAALVGKGPERAQSIVRPRLDLTQPHQLPATLQLDLLGRRPDVVAARLRAEAASHHIDVAHAEFYPNVNLSGFIGLQSLGIGQLTKSGSVIDSVGPAISLPIFSGGRLRAQLKGARADYDEAVANYDETVNRALQSVADAATSQRALAGQVTHSGESVDAAREAWQISQDRYRGGLANYLDVLAAQEVLLANQRVLTDLQSRAVSLDVAMVRALGGGFRVQ